MAQHWIPQFGAVQDLRETLARLRVEGIADRNVCFVLRTNEEVHEYAGWLKTDGESVRRLDKSTSDDQDKPGLRVSTMHRVKGLEFGAVIIAGDKSPECYAESTYPAAGRVRIIIQTQRPIPRLLPWILPMSPTSPSRVAAF